MTFVPHSDGTQALLSAFHSRYPNPDADNLAELISSVAPYYCVPAASPVVWDALSSKHISPILSVLLRRAYSVLKNQPHVLAETIDWICADRVSQRERASWLPRLEAVLPDLHRISYFSQLGYFCRSTDRTAVQRELVANRNVLIALARRFKGVQDPLPVTARQPTPIEDCLDPCTPVRDTNLQQILTQSGWGSNDFAQDKSSVIARAARLRDSLSCRVATLPFSPAAEQTSGYKRAQAAIEECERKRYEQAFRANLSAGIKKQKRARDRLAKLQSKAEKQN